MHKCASLVIILLAVSTLPLHSQDTGSNDTTFKKAERYFFQKKYAMAEVLLQEEIKKHPENSRAYGYLGDIFLNNKRYDAALNSYKKALDIAPENGENYFRIGQIYYYKQLGRLAIDHFRKAVMIDPSLKFAYYHIGLSYLMLLRDKKNTIENWETFLRMAPEDPQYEKIARVIDLLKDPNFVIPPPESEVSIEEALLLGGQTLKDVERVSRDKQAGHEKKKTKKKLEEIYLEDDL